MKIVIDLTPPNGHGFSIAHEEPEPDLTGPMRPVVDEIVVRFDGREMTAGAFRAWARRLAEVELSTDPAHAGEVTRLREMFRSEQEMAAAVVTGLSNQIAAQDRRITELVKELAEREQADEDDA